MEQIVIFGAGSGGYKIAKILNDLGYSIRAYVDNDPKKWNSYIEDVKIISPQEIVDQDAVIIASVYEESIQKQLEDMGRKKQICLKEEYINQYAKEHFNEIKEIAENYSCIQNQRIFIIESEIGLGHWGVEQYVRTLARILLQEQEHVIIHTNMYKPYEFNQDIEQYIRYFRYYEMDYWTAVKEIAKEIVKNLPCVIVDNWQSRTLTAAVILKKIYPDEIKIVSMMHNDLIRSRKINGYYKEIVDVAAAVSLDVLNKYKEEFLKGDGQKTFYKESPIYISQNEEKQYELDRERPVRIAYGARLVKALKRAHLLLKVIDVLEDKNVNYCLDIAGSGECMEELEQKIKSGHLNGKIRLKGNLGSDKMSEYWRKHDIFINLSNSEGVGFSMLEAMAEGCVPIVTKVAGTEEFIEYGKNGYYVESDNIEQLAEKIAELEKNREGMVELGRNAKRKIEEKCGCKAFYDKFIKQFN